VSPVKYELGFYIPEDGILHSHRRENLRSYTCTYVFVVHCMTSVNLVVNHEEEGIRKYTAVI
jgi:hypothetical protein